MESQNLFAGALASALLYIASAITASASTVLADGTFSSVTVTSSYSANSASITTFAPCTSCGNTGAALKVTVDGTNSIVAGVSDIGFIDNVLSYDPGTQGAITSINASYDRLLDPNFSLSVPYNFRLVIEQGGVYYATAINTGGTDTGHVWHNLSVSNLLAASFSAYNFATGVTNSALHPDFSGGPILFGVAALVNVGAGQTSSAIYDNLSVTVNPTPLPAAISLFASGLSALGLLGWRRKKKAAALPA